MNEVKKEEQEVLETQSIPLRNYLMKHVMPTLSQGLVECTKIRPDDPVDFLVGLNSDFCQRVLQISRLVKTPVKHIFRVAFKLLFRLFSRPNIFSRTILKLIKNVVLLYLCTNILYDRNFYLTLNKNI